MYKLLVAIDYGCMYNKYIHIYVLRYVPIYVHSYTYIIDMDIYIHTYNSIFKYPVFIATRKSKLTMKGKG